MKYSVPTMNYSVTTMNYSQSHSPPPVHTQVGRSSKPGVQEIDTTQGFRPPCGRQESGVIVQPETFPEPVDGVYGHDLTVEEPSEISQI